MIHVDLVWNSTDAKLLHVHKFAIFASFFSYFRSINLLCFQNIPIISLHSHIMDSLSLHSILHSVNNKRRQITHQNSFALTPSWTSLTEQRLYSSTNESGAPRIYCLALFANSPFSTFIRSPMNTLPSAVHALSTHESGAPRIYCQRCLPILHSPLLYGAP